MVGTREWEGQVLASSLKATTRLVALALSRYADFDSGTNARPGFQRLADDCGAGLRTVERAVQELTAAGYLILDSRGSGGPKGGRAAVYSLAVVPRHPPTQAGIDTDNSLQHPPTEAGIETRYPPTQAGIGPRHPPVQTETPAYTGGLPIKTSQVKPPPPEPLTTQQPADPAPALLDVVLESLRSAPAVLRTLGAGHFPGVGAALAAAGWTAPTLRAALPPGTWSEARNVQLVHYRLKELAQTVPPVSTAGTRAPLMPACTTCGARAGAPRAERMVQGERGWSPCPGCRPADVRAAARRLSAV